MESSRMRPSDEDLERMAADLLKFVRNDHLVRAKLLMKNLRPEERSVVVGMAGEDGSAALFLASQLGRISFVNFLLEECHANIEQRGTYEVAEDRSRHEVTPLWCAAVADKLEVVRTLVRHGAEVNALSDTMSTPVRSACYMTNIDVVRFLLESGADIHRPNVNGGTCLINSVQSVELCQLLIENGASVNAADNSGNLALHYAIREGRLDAVRLLLNHGSDTDARNDFGDDALQTAALRGHIAILEYLLADLKPDPQRHADIYSLVAANCVDEKHDIELAMQFWRKSVAVRSSCPPITLSPPKAAYNNVLEAVDDDALDDLQDNVDYIYMHALVVRERILGPDHKDTIFGLMYRGAVYADTHAYQRCIDLWKFAFELRRATPRSSVLAHEYIFTLQALCKLFWEIHSEDLSQSSAADTSPRFSDVSDVFAMAVDEVKEAMVMLAASETTVDVCPEELDILLQLCLHLINLLCRLTVTDAQNTVLMHLVHSLVRSNAKNATGRSLLHLAMDPATSLVAEEFYSELPNLSVIAILLEAGANIDAVDTLGNTALHVATSVRSVLPESISYESIVGVMLQYNAHIDICNRAREDVLSALPVYTNILHYRTLKCLAAHTLREHNIAYHHDVIPASLVSFVDLH